MIPHLVIVWGEGATLTVENINNWLGTRLTFHGMPACLVVLRQDCYIEQHGGED